MDIKFYLVGGAVRDELAGKISKDLDYTVEAPSYSAMRDAITARGGEIFLEQEKFLTIRAKVPDLGASDFVLARKDGTYDKDGRRPDFVEPGTLLDDLARRDFTVNAMAKAEDGTIIDPYNGRDDLLNLGILRCVGDTATRMREDSLRILRAIRFSIVKDLAYSDELFEFLQDDDTAPLLAHISIERVREELYKCFTFSTPDTLKELDEFPAIRDHIFSRNIRLTPTVFAL